jgi:hypothetical protein
MSQREDYDKIDYLPTSLTRLEDNLCIEQTNIDNKTEMAEIDFKSMEIDNHMLKNGKRKKVYVFKLLN